MTVNIQYMGKLMIAAGLIIAAAGLVFFFSGKIPWVGRLPGDFIVRKRNFTIYFPLATSILLSILITFIFWLIRKR